jgi:hypothetical protein
MGRLLTLLVGVSAGLIVILTTVVRAQEPPSPGAPSPSKGKHAAVSPAIPSPEELLILVRTTTIALDQANKTGNYAVLRQLGARGLKAYSDAQLAQTFETLRANRVNLAPAAIVTPELIEKPIVSPEGMLIVIGRFPRKPLQIEFKFVFEADRSQWKPFGLSISMIRPAP